MSLLFLIFLLPSLSVAMDCEEAESIAKRQSMDHDLAVKSFLDERMEYESSIYLDERAGCYRLPGGGVTKIITINEKGVVDLVVSSKTNAKSECFRNACLGTKLKKPPKAPIF